MDIAIGRGRELLTLDIDETRCVGLYKGPAALADGAEAVRQALEAPLEYPALRRALTPDDHLALVVDEALPGLAALLVPVLEHIRSAGVALDSVVLLCATGGEHPWIDDLPDEFGDVHVEDHDPREKRKLAYLATTRAGRRLYLNRTLVEAEQVVVLSGRRFDPILGYGGAEGAIYPALADAPTLDELAKLATRDDPREVSPTVRDEANEVAWLLGQPFHVQVMPAANDRVAAVIAGTQAATQAGREQLEASWAATLPRPADVVVVSLSGDPSRHTFADLARAAHMASRVVTSRGRVVVLSDAAPELPPGLERLTRGEEPEDLLLSLRKSDRPEDLPAIHWVRAITTARVSLWSRLPASVVEDLGATPLDDAAQVRRLVAEGSVAVFQDGHRWLARVEG